LEQKHVKSKTPLQQVERGFVCLCSPYIISGEKYWTLQSKDFY